MLKSFSDLFLIAQREGLLAIEKHVRHPIRVIFYLVIKNLLKIN